MINYVMRKAYSVTKCVLTHYTLRIIPLLLLVACGGDEAIGSAAVAPAALDPNTLFYDGFSPGQTGGWVLERDDVGQTAVFDDQLVINKNPHVIIASKSKDFSPTEGKRRGNF